MRVALALDVVEARLCRQGAGIELGMIIRPLAEDKFLARLFDRVERDEEGRAHVDALEPVHPVGHAHLRLVAAYARGAQVVPG